MDENEEFEEEEYYVYADFESTLTSLAKINFHYGVKLIGIDSEFPIMDINGRSFKGFYDHTVGTHILFQRRKKRSKKRNAIFEDVPRKSFEYLGKTCKVITMRRLFINLEIQSDEEYNSEEENNEVDEDQAEENSNLECNDKSLKDEEEEEYSSSSSEDSTTLEDMRKYLGIEDTLGKSLDILLPPGMEAPRNVELDEEIMSDDSEEMDEVYPKFENPQEMADYVEDCDDSVKDPDYNPKIIQ